MNRQELISQIKQKQSFLCVGLDTDIEKIPSHLLVLEDPIFEFNKPYSGGIFYKTSIFLFNSNLIFYIAAIISYFVISIF